MKVTGVCAVPTHVLLSLLDRLSPFKWAELLMSERSRFSEDRNHSQINALFPK